MYYLLVKEKRLFNYQQKSGNDKTFAIAQRGPTTGPRMEFVRPAEQFCTSNDSSDK